MMKIRKQVTENLKFDLIFEIDKETFKHLKESLYIYHQTEGFRYFKDWTKEEQNSATNLINFSEFILEALNGNS